jgi:hypothetical protein
MSNRPTLPGEPSSPLDPPNIVNQPLTPPRPPATTPRLREAEQALAQAIRSLVQAESHAFDDATDAQYALLVAARRATRAALAALQTPPEQTPDTPPTPPPPATRSAVITALGLPPTIPLDQWDGTNHQGGNHR